MNSIERTTRTPVVAGMFYPEEPGECRQAIEDLFSQAGKPAEGTWIGALLPHAGWICSGQVAVDAIVSLQAAHPSPDVIVVFGAVHTVGGIAYGALDDHWSWQLPTGLAQLAGDIQEQLLQAAPSLRVDPRVHRREHAIEVLMPLLQHAWPDVPVLPIEVPPIEQAAEIGRETAAALKRMNLRAIFIASSDLTHYGPNYGIMHAGVGQKALDWARENDRTLLAKIETLRAREIVAETQENQNACGGGAIAALLGACLEMGATEARVLRHTNSFEVLSKSIGSQSADNFVGYASAVVG